MSRTCSSPTSHNQLEIHASMGSVRESSRKQAKMCTDPHQIQRQVSLLASGMEPINCLESLKERRTFFSSALMETRSWSSPTRSGPLTNSLISQTTPRHSMEAFLISMLRLLTMLPLPFGSILQELSSISLMSSIMVRTAQESPFQVPLAASNSSWWQVLLRNEVPTTVWST